MAFLVETTPEAERDAEAILEWLLSQHAGDTGIRWFWGWKARLRRWPMRRPGARLLPKMLISLLRCGTCSMAASPMCTG
jgi:hypothetical protein